MFIWMAKFGAAYGVRTGIHVGVDVLVNMLPAGVAQARDRVRPAVRRAVHRHRRGVRRRLRLADVRTPASSRTISKRRCGSSISAIPLGSGLMCFRFLQVAWWFYRTGELPHHDAAHVEGVETSTALHRRADAPADSGAPADGRARSALILDSACRSLIVAICFAHAARPDRAAAGHARRHRVRAAARADADRHAGLDRARPDRADLHVHADRRADRIGRAEAVHRASKASRSWRSRSSSWPATSSPTAASRAA